MTVPPARQPAREVTAPSTPAPKRTTPASSAPGSSPPPAGGYGYAPEKDALVKRLRRIEGQVRGLERMVADDRYCVDILTQISAVSTALDSVAFRILDAHVNHCVADALAAGDPDAAATKSRELLAAVHRFMRSR